MADDTDKCIFCHIASGKVPSRKVYEDESFVAVLDINPANPGHLLVIPKEHISVMPQMNEKLAEKLGIVAKKLSQFLLKKLGVEGTSVFIANGMVAGQRAPHLMMHVIPRYADDNVKLSVVPGKMTEEETKIVLSKLAPAVEKQFGVKLKNVEPMPNEPEVNLDDITKFLTK
ncbi:HIT family protein [Candidatus Woesearchaeota archaeon]|nr:HIT family protein [Candidatus Woesearchaeota archaeon]